MSFSDDVVGLLFKTLGEVSMNNTWNKFIYKLWSPIYDQFFNSGKFLKARKKLIQEIDFERSHKILFVGVGTGADLELMNHSELDISAIDFSPDMLKKAKSKLSDSTIKFIEMDAQDMQFDDRTFDIVIGSLIISVVPDPDKCFQEMSRVLKPEGKMIIFDKFTSEDGKLPLLKTLIRAVIKVLGTDIGLNFEKLYIKHKNALVVEKNTPVMMDGMYRIIEMKKVS